MEYGKASLRRGRHSRFLETDESDVPTVCDLNLFIAVLSRGHSLQQNVDLAGTAGGVAYVRGGSWG